MLPNFPGQNSFGGEYMNHQEITLGQVTYEICRVFIGNDPAAELVLEQLVQKKNTNPSFDERCSDTL